MYIYYEIEMYVCLQCLDVSLPGYQSINIGIDINRDI